MADNFMDHLPSSVREGIRKRMRSPEAYEKLREKVKGPEDLEQEMARSEKLAELNFAMESEPKTHEAVKKQIEKDLAEQGSEALFETAPDEDAQTSLEQGKFIVQVSSHPSTHEDALVVIPEGNVQEKLPIKMQLTDRYVGQFLSPPA